MLSREAISTLCTVFSLVFSVYLQYIILDPFILTYAVLYVTNGTIPTAPHPILSIN